MHHVINLCRFCSNFFFASTVIIQETFIFCMYNQYINVYLCGMGHVKSQRIFDFGNKSGHLIFLWCHWICIEREYPRTSPVPTSFDQLDYNADGLLPQHIWGIYYLGPCGPAFPKAKWMDKAVCTKGFPKEFKDNKSLSGNGHVYLLYARPDNGRVID